MKSKIIIFILGIIVISGIIWAVGYRTDSGSTSEVSPIATSTPSETDGVVTENNAPAIITSGVQKTNFIVPSIPTPVFDKPLVFPENFTDAQKKDVQAHVDQYVAELKANEFAYEAWIDLGLYRKNIKDYQGAFEAWNFASSMYPDDTLPLLNIASLYGYDLRDTSKAEKYYAKAIDLKSPLDYPYFAAAMFYEEVLQDIPKAISIVEIGIKAIPSSLELRAYKSGLEETLANKK